MLSRPPEETQKSSYLQNLQHNTLDRKQYGPNIPIENLTHITAYLDPPSLLSLSLVNRFFYAHVKDEHTWHRAFLLNFLGISPEGDLDSERALVLRRSESTWRKEYVRRFNIRRRWERSRNGTITHAPVHSPISAIHLLPSNSLLTSSLQYGIVARSIPLNGKTLRGFLSPSPSGTGLGIGNPNTEFSPNVTACAISSEGGTAKIAWGLRSGEVTVMIAAKTMDVGTRSAAKLIRCKVDEEHEGEVVDVAWDEAGAYIASAAKDGRVKVWDAKKVRCVWTSEYLIPDMCTQIALVASKGCVFAAMRSGDLMCWTGLSFSTEDSPPVASPKGTRVPYPTPTLDPGTGGGQLLPTITSLHVDASSTSDVNVLLTYQSLPEFYRVIIDLSNPSPHVVKYYDTSFGGAVTCLLPCFSRKPNESSFVIAGDQLGWVSVYPCPSSPSASANVSPAMKFEAHLDGSAVVALAWNNITLITGSVNGSTSVFDAFTFEKLREFNTPVPRPRGGNGEHVEGVKQILLSPEKDFMVVSVGDRAMAFKADPPPKNGMKYKKNSKKKVRGTVTAKGHEKLAFDQMISDSLIERDQESKYYHKLHGREREQRENLDRLGLDEIGALEYVLMLSRDEALERERNENFNLNRSSGPSASHSAFDEGVFEGDFDDISSARDDDPSFSSATMSRSSSSGPLPSSSPSRLASFSSMHTTGTPRTPSRPIDARPRSSPSNSNQKIQVSPRFRDEPREAGFGPEYQHISSSLSSSVSGSYIGNSSVTDKDSETEETHFPPISASASPPNGSTGVGQLSRSSSAGASPPARGGAWTLADTVLPDRKMEKSAWKKPLNASSSASGSSPSSRSPAPQTFSAWSSNARANTSDVAGSSSAGLRDSPPNVDEEDEDLKLAIQLSLEEVRRQGEYS